MNRQWVYLDNFEINPNYSIISCDTRDFHLIGDIQFESNSIFKKFTNRIKKENLINKKDILKWLKDVEPASGGKHNWRYLNVNLTNCRNWRLKYIRFVKYDKDRYIVCNDILDVVDYNKVIDNICKESLMYHND